MFNNKIIKSWIDNKFLIIVIVFISSKIIIYQNFLQIHSGFESYWQLAHVDLLRNDLFDTIKYLHMQPPLWNLIVGLLLKISDGNYEFSSKIILNIHWFFSFFILLIIKYFCEEFNLNSLSKSIIYLIFIFHPSIIFFENIPYYAHSVVFLFTVMSLLIYKLQKTNKYKYEIYFYLIITILIYLISAFVPLLLIAFFIIFRFLDNLNKQNHNFFIKFRNFILILIIAFIPYLKNYFIFGTFTKGTWSGLQLATTTTNLPDLTNQRVFYKCGLGLTFGDQLIKEHRDSKKKELENYFKKYKKDPNKLNHESIIGEKSTRNHLAMISRSEWCLRKNLENINYNKIKWIKGRINEFLLPHSQLAIDYDIIEIPNGFEKIKEIKKNLYKKKSFKRAKQIFVFVFMLLIYLVIIYKILSHKEKSYVRSAYLFIFLVYAYIMLISSLFGNQEGQRFMHYGFIIQILFFINVFKMIEGSKLKLFKYFFRY